MSRDIKADQVTSEFVTTDNKDVVKLDELGEPTDNTNLDTSISRHGLFPKLPNEADKLFRGDGNWLKHNFTASTNPTVDNDVDEGYTAGSKWLNINNKEVFECLENTDGAAVWVRSAAKGNYSASVDPDADNDIDEGYVIGSLWINTASDEPFICVDNTDGAAVWVNIVGGGGGTHASTHEDGGLDEITIQNLGSGVAAANKLIQTDGSGGLTLIDTPSGEATTANSENVPFLEYSSASVVNVKALSGASTTLRMILNNGFVYSATSPLTVDMATTGLGGREASSDPEAADTWYYIYAVPETSEFLDVIASVNDPDTGPADYSAWKYLGAVRNDGSSDIKQFRQEGNEFFYITGGGSILSSGSPGDIEHETSYAEVSLANQVPDTCTYVQMSLYISIDPENPQAKWRINWSVDGTNLFYILFAAGDISVSARDSNTWYMPVSSSKSIWRKRAREQGSLDLVWINYGVLSWIDGWLTTSYQKVGSYSHANGDLITVSEGQRSSDLNVNAIDTQIWPQTGTLPFTALIDGLYKINFTVGMYFNSSTTVQVKLVFDEGESNEQTIGYDDDWQIKVVDGYDYPFFQGSVTLSAGAHTIKAYAKETVGTGAVITGSSTTPIQGPVLQLQAITGSGAGGVIVTEDVGITSYTESESALSWHDILDDTGGNPIQVQVTVSENEIVNYKFSGNFRCVTGDSGQNFKFRIYVVEETLEVIRRSIGTETVGVDIGGAFQIELEKYFSGLSAGTYTIKAQYYKLHSSISLRFTWHSETTLSVIQYRGGLVPVKQEGTLVSDKPAAFNFIGAKVENNNGIADITLGTNAPGDLITVSEGTRSASLDINATDTLIWPESGSLSFTTLVNGEYRIGFTVAIGCTDSTTTQIKLVFDEGESNEQVIGYDDDWTVRNVGNQYSYPLFQGNINLTAGNHTIKAYAKEAYGTSAFIAGPSSANAPQGPVLQLQAITGSGAGGVIVTEDTGIAAYNESGSAGTWHDVLDEDSGNPIQVQVTISENERAYCSFDANTKLIAGSSNQYYAFRIYNVEEDSTVIFRNIGAEIGDLDVGSEMPIHIERYLSGLSAGTYTFKAQYYKTHAAITLRFGWHDSTVLSVVQYRGGLVPVKQEGTLVSDKPAAFNFIGSTVSEFGGIIDISNYYFVEDDFNDSSIHDRWTVTENGSCTVVEGSDGIVISAPSGDHDGQIAMDLPANMHCRNWVAYCNITMNITSGNRHGLSLRISGKGGGVSAKIMQATFRYTTAKYLHLYDSGGGGDQISISTTACWVRIRKFGDSVRVDYYPGAHTVSVDEDGQWREFDSATYNWYVVPKSGTFDYPTYYEKLIIAADSQDANPSFQYTVRKFRLKVF